MTACWTFWGGIIFSGLNCELYFGHGYLQKPTLNHVVIRLMNFPWVWHIPYFHRSTYTEFIKKLCLLHTVYRHVRLWYTQYSLSRCNWAVSNGEHFVTAVYTSGPCWSQLRVLALQPPCYWHGLSASVVPRPCYWPGPLHVHLERCTWRCPRFPHPLLQSEAEFVWLQDRCIRWLHLAAAAKTQVYSIVTL